MLKFLSDLFSGQSGVIISSCFSLFALIISIRFNKKLEKYKIEISNEIQKQDNFNSKKIFLCETLIQCFIDLSSNLQDLVCYDFDKLIFDKIDNITSTIQKSLGNLIFYYDKNEIQQIRDYLLNIDNVFAELEPYEGNKINDELKKSLENSISSLLDVNPIINLLKSSIQPQPNQHVNK